MQGGPDLRHVAGPGWCPARSFGHRSGAGGGVRIASRPDLDGPDRSPVDQHGPPVGQVELFDLAAEDRLADPPPQLRRIGTRGQFVRLPVDHQFDSHGPRFAQVFDNGKCRGGQIGYGVSLGAGLLSSAPPDRVWRGPGHQWTEADLISDEAFGRFPGTCEACPWLSADHGRAPGTNPGERGKNVRVGTRT